MKKADIENLVAARLRDALEAAIVSAVEEVNRAGSQFEPADPFLQEWHDAEHGQMLSITCAIAVGVTADAERPQRVDDAGTRIVEWYLALAESGRDREATLLNLFEGDIQNGGFYQLYEDKGIVFIERAVTLLERIGAKRTGRLAQRALTLLRKHEASLKGWQQLRKALLRLDTEFYALDESIPKLLARHRGVG